MSIKIDKDIPLPVQGKDLPFGKMEVGDSFLVPRNISHSYMQQLVHKAQKKLAWQFSLRRTKDGPRCWRVE